ncbi:hypothetical protein D3C80_2099260 [compost metagenome]
MIGPQQAWVVARQARQHIAQWLIFGQQLVLVPSLFKGICPYLFDVAWAFCAKTYALVGRQLQ